VLRTCEVDRCRAARCVDITGDADAAVLNSDGEAKDPTSREAREVEDEDSRASLDRAEANKSASITLAALLADLSRRRDQVDASLASELAEGLGQAHLGGG
jgi:hypothetical protein